MKNIIIYKYFNWLPTVESRWQTSGVASIIKALSAVLQDKKHARVSREILLCLNPHRTEWLIYNVISVVSNIVIGAAIEQRWVSKAVRGIESLGQPTKVIVDSLLATSYGRTQESVVRIVETIVDRLLEIDDQELQFETAAAINHAALLFFSSKGCFDFCCYVLIYHYC